MNLTLDHLPQSLRLLSRHKRFAILAIVCLGVSVALNTTLYSVLDVMINPKLAMRAPKQLFYVAYYGDYRRLISGNEYNGAMRSLSFAEDFAGMTQSQDDRVIERGNRVQEGHVLSVTPNYFRVLGVSPSAGRLIGEGDFASDERPVVVSERLWAQLFPDLRRDFQPATILISGQPRRVVGTLPHEADLPGSNTDVWQLPVPADLADMRLRLARMKPDATIPGAEAELQTLALRFQQVTGPEKTAGFRIISATSPPFRPWRFHWAMIGSVAAVLLIACANLANLQLARGVSRARELATRAAIGATRRDIIKQLSIESAWLALGGLLLAAVLTAWGFGLVDAYVPREVATYVSHAQLSWRVLAFALGAMLFCLVLIGVAPAWKLSRVDIDSVLKSGAGTGKTVSARRQYGALVVVEIALALSLLCSAGLLVRAAWEVHAFRISREMEGIVQAFTAAIRTSPADRRTNRDWSEILVTEALKDTAVRYAATYRTLGTRRGTVSLDDPGGAPIMVPAPKWTYELVSPDFLRVMGLDIVAGRNFSPGEFAEPGVIVDEGVARYLWPGVSPLGRLVKLDSAHGSSAWLEVVGVTQTLGERYFDIDADRRRFSRMATQPRDGSRLLNRAIGTMYVLNAADTAQLQLPQARPGKEPMRMPAFFQVVARGEGNALRLVAPLKRRLGSIGPNVFSPHVVTAEEASGVGRVRARQDFMATLFAAFALMALALAAMGVYAIIAHTAAQRTREIGVRIALGAATRDIRDLVMRDARLLALSGLAIGLLITYYSAGLLRAFLFSDWDRYDSRVFAVVALLLFIVALVASWIPARRASSVNPVEALRND